MDKRPENPQWFRQVLGHFPTGVCAMTSMSADEQPLAMVIGSFSSVSLEPPLVCFFPAVTSGSWAAIQPTGRFCVNVLASHQGELCARLASKDPDKFADVPHQLSPLRSPIIDGALAWIDCEIESVTEAGDHHVVIGAVRSLDIGGEGEPMLFFKGAYGRFAP